MKNKPRCNYLFIVNLCHYIINLVSDLMKNPRNAETAKHKIRKK